MRILNPCSVKYPTGAENFKSLSRDVKKGGEKRRRKFWVAKSFAGERFI